MPKIEYVSKNFRPASLALIEKIDTVVSDYERQGFSLTSSGCGAPHPLLATDAHICDPAVPQRRVPIFPRPCVQVLFGSLVDMMLLLHAKLWSSVEDIKLWH